MDKKNIVILGAGFGGFACGNGYCKRLKRGLACSKNMRWF